MAARFDAFATWQLQRPAFQESGLLDADAFYLLLCVLESLPAEMVHLDDRVAPVYKTSKERAAWIKTYQVESVALERLAMDLARHWSNWAAAGKTTTNVRDYCMQHLTMDLDVGFLGALTRPSHASDSLAPGSDGGGGGGGGAGGLIWVIGRASQDSAWCVCVLFELDPASKATTQFLAHPDNNIVAPYVAHKALLWSGTDREGRNIYQNLLGAPRALTFIPLAIVPSALINANVAMTSEDAHTRAAVPWKDGDALSIRFS